VSGVRALPWLAAVLALAACDTAPTACPAVGWTNGLTVRPAEDWPPGEGRTVRVDGAQGVAPLSGRSAAVSFPMTAPDSVAVTVLGPDGAVLGRVDADLDCERVGGSEECGGPHEATATVPAP
jgi:hypothetical protein